MNEQPLINLIGVRSRASPSQAAGTPGPPLDTRARMPRFTRAFSMVRTVMRRAAPPAALGLVAINRDVMQTGSDNAPMLSRGMTQVELTEFLSSDPKLSELVDFGLRPGVDGPVPRGVTR